MAKKTEEKVEEPKNYEQELLELKASLHPKKHDDIYVSTGSLSLDISLGGKGWKLGRQASLVAWYGSGKTTLCLETIHQAEITNLEYGYIDTEGSLDEKYIRNLGIDWEKFEKRLFQPNNGEEAFEIAKKLIKAGCKIIIFDSTSGMLPQKMMEAEAGEYNIGKHATLFSLQIPVLHNLAVKNNVLLIYTCQIREKIGMMFGSPETTQGGNAQPFFDDYRVEIRKTLEKNNGDKEDATGVTSRYKVVKNKVAAPYKTGEYSIVFGTGINRIKEIVDISSEIELLYKHGQTIKINKDTPEEVKYDLAEFYDLLENNEEFYLDLKNKILSKLNLK